MKKARPSTNGHAVAHAMPRTPGDKRNLLLAVLELQKAKLARARRRGKEKLAEQIRQRLKHVRGLLRALDQDE